MGRVLLALRAEYFLSLLRNEEVAMSHEHVAPHTCKGSDVLMCLNGLAKDHMPIKVNVISKEYSLVFVINEVETNLFYVTC